MITYKMLENQLSMIIEYDNCSATLDVGGRLLRGNTGDVRYVLYALNDLVSQLRSVEDLLDTLRQQLSDLADRLA